MDGSPEWTEVGHEQGLDHLAMLSIIESHYQSLLPGFSSVTTRLRNYSFYAYWVCYYKKHIRNNARNFFEDQTRRIEALYALASAQLEKETGVAGSTFANEKLQKGDDPINFITETDFNSPQNERYLAPRGGAFPGIYSGPMSDIGIIARGEEHNLPVPMPGSPCEKLAEAYGNAIHEFSNQFHVAATAGMISRSQLSAMIKMAPSKLDQESEEAEILRALLMGDYGEPNSNNRRLTLLNILEIADRVGAVTEKSLRWWWMDNAPDGRFAEIHKQWQYYQVGDMVRNTYEALLNKVVIALEDHHLGLSLSELLELLLEEVPDVSMSEYFTIVLRDQGTLHDQFSASLSADASIDTILAPFAHLWKTWSDRVDELYNCYGNLAGVQSCASEFEWISSNTHRSAKDVVSDLISKRVIGRHLDVAARKFKIQGTYTYRIEIDEARLVARQTSGLSPSGPRLATAISFLEDIDFLSEGNLTPRGKAYLEASV